MKIKSVAGSVFTNPVTAILSFVYLLFFMKNFIKMIIILTLVLVSIFAVNSFSYASDFDIKSLQGKFDIYEIAGYSKASSSIPKLSDSEIEDTIFNDLITELRPFLGDIIDERIDKNHVFSSKEAINIIVKHPAKFVTAMYNYVVYNIKNIFVIAEDNAHIES